MTLQKTNRLYEVLVRFAPDGNIQGAHQIFMERVMDGEDVLSEKPGSAIPINPESVSSVIEESVAAVIADNAALRAAIQTRDEEAEALAGELAARFAEIESLKAQVTQLKSAASTAGIHKAYFRAALAAMEKLEAVDAFMATQSALKQELWAGATTIDITDADIIAVASALDIDLAATLARAKEIRAGDRGAA